MTGIAEVVRVFVASPSDVKEERTAVEGVVREMNETWSKELGYRLDLVRWETDTYPGFGEDAQDVVNRQIGDEYDVFVGIMWTRVGTPTQRSDSGTVEEFTRAYERYKADPSTVHLMMYFKNKPVEPDGLDPFQLSKVMGFRQRLSDLGGLYKQFQDSVDFERMLRVDLSRLLQDRKKASGTSVAVAEPDAPEARPPKHDGRPARLSTSDGDLGYLDLVEEAEVAFTRLGESVTSMTAAQAKLGSEIAIRSREMEAVISLPPDLRRKAAMKIASQSAADMDEFTAVIEAELPVYTESLNEALDCFGKAAALSVDFKSEDTAELRDARDSLVRIHASMTSARESLQGFRDSVAGLPRLTSDLSRAKRRVLEAADVLLRVMANGQSLVTTVISGIESLLADVETPRGSRALSD